VPGSGLHPRPGSTESLKQHFAEVDTSWNTLYYPSRKGETVQELHNRIDTFTTTFVPAVIQRLPLEKHRRLLLVTHAATTIALIHSFLGDRDMYIKVGCCSLSELERKTIEEGVSDKQVIGAWKPLSLASGDHLQGGSSREWGFEDIEVEKGRVSVLFYTSHTPPVISSPKHYLGRRRSWCPRNGKRPR